MRVLFVSTFCLLFLVGCVHASVVRVEKEIVEPEDKKLDPVTCIKCEIVVQLFNFINDAIIGGQTEDDLKNAVIKTVCSPPIRFKKFCDELIHGNLWDTIFKALRDSIGTFFDKVAPMLGCNQTLKKVQTDCEPQ